ncbi:MAG: prepilin-type N-terminal cleavage/methylation domain-containing protein [Candidatus Riflebacteria bacterium]|nr:prepilin-type N-terminal cleavage/methylation domain-containing protein [Candidatus Riflebacteria bacterium]
MTPALLRKGFSLIEILIALAIMALMLIPLWNQFAQSTSIIRIGQHDLEVLNIGLSFTSQASLFDFERMTYLPKSPITQIGSGDIQLEGYRIHLPSWNSQLMKLESEVRELGSSLAPRDLKIVQLTVRWKESLGPERVGVFPVLLTKKRFRE